MTSSREEQNTDLCCLPSLDLRQTLSLDRSFCYQEQSQEQEYPFEDCMCRRVASKARMEHYKSQEPIRIRSDWFPCPQEAHSSSTPVSNEFLLRHREWLL